MTPSKPSLRAAGIGGLAAVILIGAFALGTTRGSAAAAGQGTVAGRSGSPAGAELTSAGAPARITVTGSGTVTGTPDQLTLDMGVQVNGGTVNSALQQANQDAARVTAALRGAGVAAADIQTSGLSIQPTYASGSSLPDGYGVSESLTATLVRLAVAGAQIEAAVRAGGNAVTVDDVSLNLADSSGLLASARTRAVADARVKAAQYAKAAGRPLGPVISITDQSQDGGPPVPAFAPAAGKAAAVPISPGSAQVSVSVTVVYALA
ncbi:MAG TPA: SIMPL domain-containing protein [Streptosporangiaceae bacterium]|jgi:hypothetical protein